ncbi:MAG: DUF1015 domain-containing protein [Firmicutes bacterium]|nr:DUF1015 domain-containing protein [Bacillota bacterium]
MAEIKPFNGYVFSPEKAGDLGKVMAPSYTVKSEDERDELYARSEYNAIRLVDGKAFDTDTQTENRFTRARDYLNKWIKDGVITKFEKPAIYLYEQAVLFNGTPFKNRGFVALLHLDDFGKQVVSCEDTTPVNKKYRFDLISQTKTNFNMISCLYIETEKQLLNLMTEISDTSPDLDFRYVDGTRERLWSICDKDKIDFIVSALSNHRLYITDGQNRFETSLIYQQECKKNNPNHTGKESYNYIMALLNNAYDDGIVQLPYHRLVKFDKPFNESFLVSALQDCFKVEKIIIDSDTSDLVDTIKRQIFLKRTQNAIALYCGKDYFYRITILDRSTAKERLKGKSDAYCSLDVAVLNSLILEDLLGINDENYDERVSYSKSVAEGTKKVKDGEFGCLFAINPVRDSQIRAVATAGEKLPSKSICLFPKPITGVIMNILD